MTITCSECGRQAPMKRGDQKTCGRPECMTSRQRRSAAQYRAVDAAKARKRKLYRFCGL